MTHLGGHFGETNMDCPTLDYLIARYEVRTMLDVGCGPGGMVDYARSRGIRAYGVDGDPATRRLAIGTWDYTHGPLPSPHPPVDLVWSVEFVEHVEACYVPNFLATFTAGRVLFLTHALPGQPGHHHVNCQDDAYWLERLAGWTVDYEATGWVRVHSENPYVKPSALVLTR